MLSRADADVVYRLVATLTEQGQFRLDLVEAGRHRAQQLFARFRGRGAARDAHQQAQGEPFFQRAHGLAQGRLRHAQLGRRPGKTAFAGHGHEGKDVVEVGLFHAHFLFISTANKFMATLTFIRDILSCSDN